MTVCNQNRVHCPRLLERLVANCSDQESDFCHHAGNLNTTGCTSDLDTDQKQRRRREVGEGDHEPGFCDTCTVSSESNTENKFLFSYMSLEKDDRKEIGHQFEATIKACTFRGRDCSSIRWQNNGLT